MKKKIITICSAALCVGMLFVGAYASKTTVDLPVISQPDETAQLQSALDNSAIVKSLYVTNSSVDEFAETGDEMQAKDEVVKALNAKNAVRVYNVSVDGETTSLKSQLGKDNEQWLLVENINGKITYIYMCKGGDFETAEKKINSLNVPDSLREKMIENARNNAGKWYVQRAEQPINDDKNIEISASENVTAQNSNSNIIDTKYICFNGSGNVSVWVETNDGEYIVPIGTPLNTNDLSGNSIYSLSNVVNNTVR